MKIILYFDVRFLHAEEDHEKADQEGVYVRAYSGDICFSFSRTVSLPCLPIRGQLYHLRFDPPCETSNSDDDTHYYVRESGFIEQDDDKATPYFVISDDQTFSDWQEWELIDKNLSLAERVNQWRNCVKQRMVRLTKLFKKHGWEDDKSER